MKRLLINSKEASAIWWAMFWRMGLLWLACGLLVGVSEYYLETWGASYDVAGYTGMLIGLISTVVTSFLTMKYVLNKKYKHFTLKLVRHEQTEQASQGEADPLK